MGESDNIEDRQHLKRVSRIKRVILQKYLPPWAIILGSRHRRLTYFDCFAGPGQYELDGKIVAGSPVIAVQSAIEYLATRPTNSLLMYLLEDDPVQVQRLQTSLESLQPYPKNLKVEVRSVDSREYVPKLLSAIRRLAPSFFLIDPYGHPLPLPVINGILREDRTEVLINLMWFRINMDLGNSLAEERLDEFFGDREWRHQSFLTEHGVKRERSFLGFLRAKLECKFLLPFKIRYDVEDSQGTSRTKYVLLHASNHVKAVLLMKEVMWPLGDEEGTFDYSGESQGVLISQTPTVEELQDILMREFRGQQLSFDEVREQTWELPFSEKHYRAAIKALEGRGVSVTRIVSKKNGNRGARPDTV